MHMAQGEGMDWLPRASLRWVMRLIPDMHKKAGEEN